MLKVDILMKKAAERWKRTRRKKNLKQKWVTVLKVHVQGSKFLCQMVRCCQCHCEDAKQDMFGWVTVKKFRRGNGSFYPSFSKKKSQDY